MADSPNPAGFPLKTALALATAVGALAGLYAYDHSRGLNPGIFASSTHVDLIPQRAQDTPAIPPPVVSPPPSVKGPKLQPNGQPAAHPPVSAYLEDPAGALDSFYASLRLLRMPETAGAPPQVVTVLHYGDSPTTADLITGDVRALLQQNFGDAGHGYLLTAKPWAWYGHRNVDISDHGWDFSTAVGKGREETYGLGGASFTGGTGANSHITLNDKNALPQTSVEIEYWASPQGGELSVQPDAAAGEAFPTSSPDALPAWHTVALPAGNKAVDLKPTSGQVRVFGETFRTGHRGVLYNSLGLNGASTSVLSNGFNSAAWAAELRHTAPAMVVINYGTNESGFGSYVDKQYEPTLRNSIARIRAAIPGVTILVMSPMDRGRRAGGSIETYDTIPRIIAIQRRVAAELGCAFFDTFDAMGGDGTMARWYTGHPRLVAGDLIHPTPQGASLVAGLFVKDLMLGYNRYLESHPGATAITPAAPEPAPAPAHPAAPSEGHTSTMPSPNTAEPTGKPSANEAAPHEPATALPESTPPPLPAAGPNR